MPKKKKIVFVCPYPENTAPSQRLKYEQYFEIFRDRGWEITIKPFISRGFWKIIYRKGHIPEKLFYTIVAYLRRYFLLLSISRYDVVYVHLWGTPFGPSFYEWLLSIVSKKMIYDIDDLVYLRTTKNKTGGVVSMLKGRKKPLFLMKNADHVITCTPYLDEFARHYNLNTTDISSTVDTDNRYTPVNSYSNEKQVTLGWSGSLSTSKYFYLLEKVLRRLKEKYQFKMLVIGDRNVKIDGLEIEAIDWNEKDEIADLQRIDIGLYPLPDEEWVLGKSGLKAIQYMALAIPTVASAIGANYRVIENGVSGFLVNTENEWAEILEKLINDAELRKKTGTAARERVIELYSIKSNTEKYLRILEEVDAR